MLFVEGFVLTASDAGNLSSAVTSPLALLQHVVAEEQEQLELGRAVAVGLPRVEGAAEGEFEVPGPTAHPPLADLPRQNLP